MTPLKTQTSLRYKSTFQTTFLLSEAAVVVVCVSSWVVQLWEISPWVTIIKEQGGR